MIKVSIIYSGSDSTAVRWIMDSTQSVRAPWQDAAGADNFHKDIVSPSRLYHSKQEIRPSCWPIGSRAGTAVRNRTTKPVPRFPSTPTGGTGWAGRENKRKVLISQGLSQATVIQHFLLVRFPTAIRILPNHPFLNCRVRNPTLHEHESDTTDAVQQCGGFILFLSSHDHI